MREVIRRGKGVTPTTIINHMVDKGPGPSYSLLNRLVEEAVVDERLSKVFAALADPTRRDIVARLATEDATVGELAEPYAVSVQAISKHLKVLEGAGLISKTKVGQSREVHLEAEVLDLMTGWIERYRRRAEQRYQRLDAVLARIEEDEEGKAS